MTQEAVVRVRLDTSQAKRELGELLGGSVGGPTGQNWSTPPGGGGAGDGGRGRGGSVRRGFGLGLGIGAGFRAASASSLGGVGDLAGEFWGPIGQNLNDMTLGIEDDRARAAAIQRERAIAAFGALAATNRDGAYEYFRAGLPYEVQKQLGAGAIRGDPRFAGISGPSVPGDFDNDHALGRHIADGIRLVGDRIIEFFGGRAGSR